MHPRLSNVMPFCILICGPFFSPRQSNFAALSLKNIQELHSLLLQYDSELYNHERKYPFLLSNVNCKVIIYTSRSAIGGGFENVQPCGALNRPQRMGYRSHMIFSGIIIPKFVLENREKTQGAFWD